MLRRRAGVVVSAVRLLAPARIPIRGTHTRVPRTGGLALGSRMGRIDHVDFSGLFVPSCTPFSGRNVSDWV
jgi:hypothetical protein